MLEVLAKDQKRKQEEKYKHRREINILQFLKEGTTFYL